MKQRDRNQSEARKSVIVCGGSSPVSSPEKPGSETQRLRGEGGWNDMWKLINKYIYSPSYCVFPESISFKEWRLNRLNLFGTASRFNSQQVHQTLETEEKNCQTSRDVWKHTLLTQRQHQTSLLRGFIRVNWAKTTLNNFSSISFTTSQQHSGSLSVG